MKRMVKKMSNKASCVEVDISAIQSYMKENNMAATNLSVQMGYDKSYLSAIFNGKTSFPKPAYKMLCLILGVDENKFSLKPKTESKVESKTVINSGISAEQLNAMLLQISTMNDNIVKVLNTLVQTMNAQSVIQGKMLDEFRRFSIGMGVKPAEDSNRPVHKDGYNPAYVKK